MNLRSLKISLLTFMLFFASIVTFAQEHSTAGKTIFGTKLESINPDNGLIRCVSSEYEKHLHKTAEDRASIEEFEAWLAPKVEAVKQRMLNSTDDEPTIITIPVVVHVIHNGRNVGTLENISDAQVMSQITALNQDFRRMLYTPGYNENPIGADIGIEFCLAQTAPDGTATTGINRVNFGVAQFTSESVVENQLKPQTIWDPTQYFNIWVVKFGNTGNLGGVLGYAQFPTGSTLLGLGGSPSTANTDGVIIDYRAFGSSSIAPGQYYQTYDKGRTATHEIGHYLGLRHIWGDNGSCTVNTIDSFQDFCPDTPAANAANYDCFQQYNSCSLAPGNDMTENYMDYSNDECMSTFTLDQKARIIAVLQNSPRRSTLTTSTVCSSLGSENFDLNKGLGIYPNPANNVINIAVGSSDILPTSYTIFNTIGQVVAVKNVSSVSDLQIDINSITTGVYFIKIDRQNASKTFKFIKK